MGQKIFLSQYFLSTQEIFPDYPLGIIIFLKGIFPNAQAFFALF
jgi:hypothetical protein